MGETLDSLVQGRQWAILEELCKMRGGGWGGVGGQGIMACLGRRWQQGAMGTVVHGHTGASRTVAEPHCVQQQHHDEELDDIVGTA